MIEIPSFVANKISSAKSGAQFEIETSDGDSSQHRDAARARATRLAVLQVRLQPLRHSRRQHVVVQALVGLIL